MYNLKFCGHANLYTVHEQPAQMHAVIIEYLGLTLKLAVEGPGVCRSHKSFAFIPPICKSSCLLHVLYIA